MTLARVHAEAPLLRYVSYTLMRERIECPTCGRDTLRPIIYGLVVDGELREKADRGEVVLGGCQVGEESPDWECSRCAERFRDRDLPG